MLLAESELPAPGSRINNSPLAFNTSLWLGLQNRTGWGGDEHGDGKVSILVEEGYDGG